MPSKQCRGEGPNLVKTISKGHAAPLAKVQHHIASGQKRFAFKGSMSVALDRKRTDLRNVELCIVLAVVKVLSQQHLCNPFSSNGGDRMCIYIQRSLLLSALVEVVYMREVYPLTRNMY